MTYSEEWCERLRNIISKYIKRIIDYQNKFTRDYWGLPIHTRSKNIHKTREVMRRIRLT